MRRFFKLIGFFLGILFVCPFITVLYNLLTETQQFPKDRPEITINKTTTLKTGKERDDQKVTLHKGDVVSLFGISGNSAFDCVYVETKDGLRGTIDNYELGFTTVTEKKRGVEGADTLSSFKRWLVNQIWGKHDTITIVRVEEKEDSYPRAITKSANGKEENFGLSDLAVLFPKEFYRFEFDNGDCYLSEEKLKRLFIGKTIKECDNLITPATHINKKIDGTYEAHYGHLAMFKPNEGECYRPILITDKNGKVVDYRTGYGAWHSYVYFLNKKWALKHLPFVTKIVDCGIFAKLIKSSLYEFSNRVTFKYMHYTPKRPTVSAITYILTLIFFLSYYLLYGICALIWIYSTEGIILSLMKLALNWRWSFYIFGDKLLEWLFAIVAIVCTYIWFVLALVFGIGWFFALGILVAGAAWYEIATEDLDTWPHNRCPKCKRMHSLERIKHQLVEEYDKTERERETGDLLSTDRTVLEKTWTETTYGNGRKEISNEREKVQTDKTYEVIHKDVGYHVKVYHDTYECEYCKHKEYVKDTKRKRMWSNIIGFSKKTVSSTNWR
ncbi:MAG: hypothetical protein IKZ99_10010 [Salinivirgaceae bacterium]|nr:hypothetical protein [Salinivirgaceae bacterium]